MYLSHSFLLSILPFLTAVVPLAQPPVPQHRSVMIPISKGSIDLSKVRNTVQKSVGKIQMGLAAYERSTGRRHPLSNGIKTLSKRDSAAIPLTDVNATFWHGTISIGTPPVEFIVDFDTGSSDIFVFSTGCYGSACSGRKTYNPSSSSTSQIFGNGTMLSFADGSIAIVQTYTDVVTIAGLTANAQALGAAIDVEGFDTPGFPDGIVGLGFESLSNYQTNPLLQTLIAEGVLTSSIFGFKLGPSDSELTIGGVDPKFNLDEDFTWVPLSNEGFWQASFDNITLYGSRNPVVGKTNAIFDTGNAMVIGDPASVDALYKPLEYFGAQPAGNGTYTIPCNFDTSISVFLGGLEVIITPATFNLGPAQDGSNRCLAGITSDPSLTGEYWVLGDVFLQNVYSAWDVGNGRIGFAPY